ncbi:C-1-tetrahydrofolate synthase, cytoplasmic [Melipona quadrifasciata]|uniref:formate--tetrahydrofolate ligase n=1 Tax=Melipona quadrifasciata TaxID=166423 RepID=A0A0M8ZTU2_9HYME|nr:C-1-tetrahydrofolate synthase, cytoplasmic [Melipona quadrifasciata]
MYGAGEVVLADKVQEKIKKYNQLGYDKLPLCMAKTSNSLTGDPSIKGAPTGFTLKITDIFVSVGAGFIVPMVGEIMMMPGLSTRPSIYDMYWNNETDEIEGLILFHYQKEEKTLRSKIEFAMFEETLDIENVFDNYYLALFIF